MDLEKTMQFIIEQQAQFSVDILQLKERMDQGSQRLDRVEVGIASLLQAQFKQLESVNHVVDAVAQLGQTVDQLTRSVAQLGQRVDQLTQSVAQLGQRVDQLTQSVAQLGQRVDQLTQSVAQLGQRVDQLTQSQQRTEDNLNALIKVVDGVIRR